METLNVAAISESTENVLGPGKRFIIWVQGCPFNCKNCVSPDWIPETKANIISISKLAEVIVNDFSIEGITISGGEPMRQANGLNKLLTIVKESRNDLNTICFTGYKIERLIESHQLQLIENLDVLIDGLYVDKLNTSKGLRGSENQRIHFVTDKLLSYKEEFESGDRNFELLDRGEEWLYIGIPEKGISNLLI